jgi:hypothetical protein
MVVRIRLGQGPAFRKERGKNRRLAAASAALLSPAALMACVLAFWRLGADLGLTGGFAISRGIFSHWQVWLALGGALQVCAITLNRYGRGGSLRPPVVIFPWFERRDSQPDPCSLSIPQSGQVSPSM